VALPHDPTEIVFMGDFGRENGYLVDTTHPMLDLYPRATPAMSFSRSTVTPGGGCLCGAHTARVLAEFGYADEVIADLAARGIVGLG
jgi:crotonobetainyl-CoA:carnitine CoA-transferase CaiB-like acyl-CoA transferase